MTNFLKMLLKICILRLPRGFNFVNVSDVKRREDKEEKEEEEKAGRGRLKFFETLI